MPNDRTGAALSCFWSYGTLSASVGLDHRLIDRIQLMVQDFSLLAGEVIDLSSTDAITSTLADDAFSLVGTTVFSGLAGQMRWKDQGTVRLIQREVNGGAIADLTIFVKAADPIDSACLSLYGSATSLNQCFRDH